MSGGVSGAADTVTRVLYPGSFDPVHNGHIEIIETAASLFDEVIVAAMVNTTKDGVFDLDDREEMLNQSVAHLDNVSVEMFTGLVVDLARRLEIDFIVKGLRAVSDFENELQMAQMNNAASGVHTLFIPSASSSSFLASKFIRDFARWGGDITGMVPDPVARKLKEQYG